MVAVFPECAIEAWRQYDQYVCIGEPVLLGYRFQDEITQWLRGRWQRHQGMFDGLIVVQASCDALHVLHDHVGLHRMQSATGRAGFLQEDRVVTDLHL